MVIVMNRPNTDFMIMDDHDQKNKENQPAIHLLESVLT